MMLLILFLVINLIAAQSPPPGFGPPASNCPPLTNCNLSCPYRFRFDSQRCEICQCRSSPCINETAILPNVECDGTANGPKCPLTHDCVVQRGNGPPPSMTGLPPSPPPTPSPTTRGLCCIHVDVAALGMGPRPPFRQRIRHY